RLVDRRWASTGNLSLGLVATESAVGRYWCIVERAGKQVKKAVVLLALVDVSVSPASPVPQDSTVILRAEATPPYAVSVATWLSPSGSALRSEPIASPGGGHMTKLPRFGPAHQGEYSYFAQPHGHTHATQFTMTINVNMSAVVEFSNPTFGMAQACVCRSRAVVGVSCPALLGDYLLLWWRQADAHSTTLAYQHDRWRQTSTNHTQLRLRLLGPAPTVAVGNYSFLFVPEQKQGGTFRCEVFLNDRVHVQETQVTVINAFSKRGVSEVQLWCLLSNGAQLQRVNWTRPARTQTGAPLRLDGSIAGRLGISIPLPITTATAGEYTCTAYLPNGQSASAVYTLDLPTSTGDITTLPAPTTRTTTTKPT
ncbi:g6f-like, partial [Engraulis encrasicolus]|uniref:g6f-like n=1 Tax=Engraulis encrasicolus TaxID=184585 RepID=UPI002FD5BD60